MQFLEVKIITSDGQTRTSEEYDDVVNIVTFKGALMLERFQAETELIDQSKVVHMSVKPGKFQKVTRG